MKISICQAALCHWTALFLLCGNVDAWYKNRQNLCRVQSSIEGLSGTVKVDRYGRRSTFNLDLITLAKDGFEKVGFVPKNAPCRSDYDQQVKFLWTLCSTYVANDVAVSLICWSYWRSMLIRLAWELLWSNTVRVRRYIFNLYCMNRSKLLKIIILFIYLFNRTQDTTQNEKRQKWVYVYIKQTNHWLGFSLNNIAAIFVVL